MRASFPILLAALLAAPCDAAPSAAAPAPQSRGRKGPAVGGSPGEQLRSWLTEIDRKGALPPEELASVQWTLSNLRLPRVRDFEERRELATNVLDLLAWLIEREAAGAGVGSTGVAEGQLARSAQRLLADEPGEIRRWMALEVAPMARTHEPPRRAAATRVLGSDQSSAARMALFACTRDEARLVRDEAVEALSGREDPAVHKLLLDVLEAHESGEAPVRTRPIETHFHGLSLERGTPTHTALSVYVRANATHESWRRASRAISLSRALADHSAAPVLIETLNIWITRAAAGLPARRVQGEILRELERRSGRRLGLKPERWRQWWGAIQEGRIGFDGHVEGQVSFSQAEFFGLRAMTDRVTFVLDRSGSMEESFGEGYSGGRTRLREAVTRMSRFLETLGPSTRFNVVLFSDGALRWRRDLQPATMANIAAAARWTLETGTGGGTHLRPGIEMAMRTDPAGAVDLEKLEADTVIVLCDGETSEGARWVAPFLRRVNDEARMLFHAVRIGGRDDGALRALCEGTGGDLVEVDG